MRIGFIGAGNMGFAMLKGAAKTFQDGITYTDIDAERLKFVQDETGIPYSLSNQEVVDQSDMIVLAVKPQ